MRMSQVGVKLLVQLEGFKEQVYRDSAGLPTVGVGHLLTQDELSSGRIVLADGRVLDFRDGLTKGEVADLLRDDLPRFEEAVERLVVVPLEQYQFDALVSFAFNVGTGAFKRSTLLRLLNDGDYAAVPGQLTRWNKAGGRVIKGLVNRRKTEGEVWRGNYAALPDAVEMIVDSNGDAMTIEEDPNARREVVAVAPVVVVGREPWWLRLLSSKINWVAGVGLMMLNAVAFGGGLSADQVAELTPMLGNLLLGAVLLLRTFLNSPK